jgi:hypothetical protein
MSSRDKLPLRFAYFSAPLVNIASYEDTFETPLATVVTLVHGDFVSGSAVYRSLSRTEIVLLYSTVAILGDLGKRARNRRIHF